MRRIKHKKLVMAISIIAVLALAGAAFAYWTASGTGSATASVGTDQGVTINNFVFSGGPAGNGKLYPSHSVTVTFDIVNNSANTPVKVGKVVADTSGGNTNGISGLAGNCLAADFHFGNVDVNTEIADGATITRSGTLSLDDTGVNQDDCKLAAPVLHLKTDNSSI